MSENLSKTLLATFAAVSFCGLTYAASVKIDNVAQRWPWNNKVDITYTITDGQDVADEVYRRLQFTINVDGETIDVDGNTLAADTTEGQHMVTWIPPKELKVKSDNCKISAAIFSSDVPSGDDYMIVNLNTGTVTYEGLCVNQEASNIRYNTALYKTTNMVFRKVVKGGKYRTGNGGGSLYQANYPKDWVTDRNFYVAIYQTTQWQYEKLMGVNPSGTDNKKNKDGNLAAHRPVDTVSWNELRASTEPTAALPKVGKPGEGSFLQRLNFLTGNVFSFDLPTEAMFEIAQLAGRISNYSFDGNVSDYVVHRGVASQTSPWTTLAVGSKKPNDWGLYDTSGNVMEWCLDDTGRADLSTAPDIFTPSWTQAPYRRVRGGPQFMEWQGTQSQYAAYRGGTPDVFGGGSGATSSIMSADLADNRIGFRVAVIVD